MRIVVAPDKFKHSLDASAVAREIEAGLRLVFDGIDVACVPMADGGEGTLATFLERGAVAHAKVVRGPLGTPVEAVFGIDGDTAIVEMANASGLHLLASHERDALRATSFGTGELIAEALALGARRIVVGIGGSANNDGGAGMLEALGARFRTRSGEPPAPGGAALAELEAADLSGLDARLRDVTIEVACDVENPLLGANGASAIFGPQKGASEDDIRVLDAALAHFADVLEEAAGERFRDDPGAGAAGGLGFGLQILGARLRSGFAIVAEARGLEAALDGAALCFTGEGRIDRQTLGGKVVSGVGRLAHARGIPVIALGGSLDPAVEPALWEHGIAAFSIVDRPLELAEAMENAAPLIRAAAARVARVLQTPTGGGAELAEGGRGRT